MITRCRPISGLHALTLSLTRAVEDVPNAAIQQDAAAHFTSCALQTRHKFVDISPSSQPDDTYLHPGSVGPPCNLHRHQNAVTPPPLDALAAPRRTAPEAPSAPKRLCSAQAPRVPMTSNTHTVSTSYVMYTAYNASSSQPTARLKRSRAAAMRPETAEAPQQHPHVRPQPLCRDLRTGMASVRLRMHFCGVISSGCEQDAWHIMHCTPAGRRPAQGSHTQRHRNPKICCVTAASPRRGGRGRPAR